MALGAARGGPQRGSLWARAVAALVLVAAPAGQAQYIARQSSKLVAADAAAGDQFGNYVAVDGDTAVIGAQWDDDGGSKSGSAYVFVRQPDESWAQVAKLRAADAAANDEFGFRVAVNGDTAVVTAWKDDDGGYNSGSAYVFERQPNGSWLQVAKLRAADAAATDEFGIGIAVNGDTIMLGARRDDDYSGSAYVFERQPGGSWVQVAKLRGTDTGVGDFFGHSIAMDGDTAVIGAVGDNGGSVYVFETQPDGSWVQVAKLRAADVVDGSSFGYSVAMGGDTAVIGAVERGKPAGSGSGFGSAYVFVKQPDGSWVQSSKFVAADAGVGDEFGFSVAMNGDTAVVGALLDDDDGTDSGSAYMFVRQPDGSWVQSSKFVAADAGAGDKLGISVAMAGDTAVIGASLDNDAGGDSGSAYVFALTCAAGTADTDNNPATACEVCASGTYAAEGAIGPTSCSPCSGGHYDDDDDSSTPCASCTPGGFATPNACDACPSGTADADADSSTPCDTCPSGSFSSASQTTCAACLSGTADTDSDPATPCIACQPGYYAPGEATTCVHCPAGYIDHDSDPATPCDSTDLHLCPAGSYAAVGSTECADCAPGYVDEDSDPSTPCSQCAPGHQQTFAGATTCISCPEGRADTDLDSATACELCENGFYAAQLSVLCSACPPGEADLDDNPATACSVCEPGGYSDEAATICDICQAGRFDDDSDASTPCLNCAAGTYTIGELSACTECAIGRADEDLNAATPCGVCVSGTFTGPASTVCDLCEPGRSDSDSNAATPCAACPRGQYNSLTGRVGGCDSCIAGRYAAAPANQDEDSCQACSPGQYAGNGSAVCESCGPGMADVDVDPATPCSICPNGTYASCGGTTCSICEPGRVDSDSDATTPCVECTPGQYWDDNELQFEEDEPGSRTSSPRVAVCVSCEAGKADTDSDSTTPCEPCSNGEYSDVGSTSCDNCGLVGMVDHDDNPATPCMAVAGGSSWLSVQADVTVDIDISSISAGSTTRSEFEADFVADMATLLGIERHRVQIDGISGGSVVVQFSVLPGPNGETLAVDTLQGAFSQGSVELAGATAGELSPPTTRPFECTQICEPGFHDRDCDNSTACTACAAGEYSSGGISPAGLCVACAKGFTDEDLDGTTACTACRAGYFSAAGGRSGQCDGCPAGRYTPIVGSIAVDVCEQCQHGQYSQTGSAACEFCSSGRADEDLNASTPCTECSSGTYAGCGATVCSQCQPGQVDGDSSSTTPCTACPAGQSWQGPTALNASACVQCEPGRADLDSDSTTGCAECGAGRFAAGGGIICKDCSISGLVDHDLDASTPCVEPNTQCTQFCEPGYGDDDCDPQTPCTECTPGFFKPELGNGECIACPSGRYESNALSLSCNGTCSRDAGTQCPGPGSTYPLPAPGYYMVSGWDEGLESLAKCTPPEGCLGGAYGEESCAVGYGGLRCAQCLDGTQVGPDEDPNGYYRKDNRCTPCGKVIPAWILAVVGVILFVILALMADQFLAKVADVSNFIAPMLILLTFFQTLALLLKFNMQWPAGLKDLMNKLSIFNINLELARPECSIKWTASNRMDVMLAVPFGGAFLILCYGASGWLFNRKDPATNSLHLKRKCESMGVGMFMLFSSFFLKGILGGIDCTPDATSGKYYLDIEPSIQCDTTSAEYNVIYEKVFGGVALWSAMFGIIVLKFFSKGGKYRYSFLTTKLEDKWFFWELVLLSRKILIMCSGLFNSSAVARGWYLGSMVIIFSLAAHAFARPFKKNLVDACEFASLLSTLVIFQSGMVWSSAVDETGLLGEGLEKLSILLVLMVSGLGIIAQIDAIQENNSDPRSYSPYKIRQLDGRSIRVLCEQLQISNLLKREVDYIAADVNPQQAKQREGRLTALKNKIEGLGHKGRCGIWVGSSADDILADLHSVQDIEMLLELLRFEHERQSTLRPRDRNKSMERELRRRLRAELVLACPTVHNVEKNRIEASSAALKLASQLVTADELEIARETLETELERAQGTAAEPLCDRILWWRRQKNNGGSGTEPVTMQEGDFDNPMHELGILDVDVDEEKQQEPSSLRRGSASGAANKVASELSEDLNRLAAELQNLANNVDTDTQILNHITQVKRRADKVLNTTIVSTINLHPSEVYIAVLEKSKMNKKRGPQLRMTSLRIGKASSVVIDQQRSGPNALALFGKLVISQGEEVDGRKTAGDCTSTSFAPYDFSGVGKSERLVVVVDGNESARHEVMISANIQEVSQLVQLLSNQPWVRRPSSAEDKTTAKEAAKALANHLWYYDPVGDGGLERTLVKKCCGLYRKDILPVPLKTDANTRRERRFEAAVVALRDEIKFRFSAGAGDDLAAALTVANRQLQQQLILSTAFSATDVSAVEMQQENEDAVDEYAQAVLDQVIGGG